MKTLGFIGMGNMAGAIAAGILQKGLMKKEEEKQLKKIAVLDTSSLTETP